MAGFQVDLTNCDREPIHIPGKVQPHGFLIAIDAEQIIRYQSDNITSFFPAVAEDFLGQPLQYFENLLDNHYPDDLIQQLINTSSKRKGFERTNPIPIQISGNPFYLIISVSKAYHLLEFEPATSSFDIDVQSMMGQSIAEILGFRKTQDLLIHSAEQVKDVILFDRVMIYRFADDGHGEVVAEAKNDDLAPWLGLHYPASDIPMQARELYKLNLTRLIADVHAKAAPISTAATNGDDLDLTYSQLRAVSPIHIQYLKNMGVASSFSISLKYKDELWGLIACHNYTTRFIDYKSREYAKLIGQILSSALEFRQDEEAKQAEDVLKLSLEKLSRQLSETENVEAALTAMPVTLLDIVKANGAVLAFDKKIYKLGVTPGDEELIKLFAWINDDLKETFFQTDNLSGIYAEAGNYKAYASGMMVSVLSKELGDYLVWFKPEIIKTVNWAGDPTKPVEANENGLMTISPRKSFETWSETVSGFAEKWTTSEILAAKRLNSDITFGLNRKAGAMRLMNERLRVAYEELESFSYTISHDLKNPIASIKSYAQLLMRDQAVLERGQKMLQRIADRADQMNLMINAVLNYSRIGRSAMIYSPIDTSELVATIVDDLSVSANFTDTDFTVGQMPQMHGDPVMILQVFSNLISNAVKYSQHSAPSQVHIEGKQQKAEVLYSIRDNGLGIATDDLPKIFELFNRMDNVSHIEGSGVGLAIVKRIVEKHGGKIWVESELGQGATFYVSFKNVEKNNLQPA